MKAKLIKTPEQFYKLKFYNDEDMLACATALLSKQNCDKIFEIIDVEKLAKEKHPNDGYADTALVQKAFIQGAKEILELNKDKVFTLSDMMMAYMQGTNDGAQFESLMDYDSENCTEPYEFAEEAEREFRESLQQPTEIEVEILMQCIDPNCDSLNRKGCCIPGDKPRINAEGYLTLKKI